MKMLSFVFMASVLAIGFAQEPSLVRADEVGQWSAGFRVNASIPKDDDTDEAPGYMGYVDYQAAEYVRAELEAGWIEWDQGILGDLHMFPVLGNLQFTYPIELDSDENTSITPYLTTGLGVLFLNFEESQTLKDAGASLDVDPSFAVKLGGGLDYRFSESWALNIDGGYILSEGDAALKQGSTTLAADNVEYDYWFIGAGLKYYW
jgi:outer membrane protein W